MIKIGFLGPPGVGKTTVAQSFAAKIRFKTEKRVELIDEHARWFTSNFGIPTIFDQYLISHRQIDKEKAISHNIDYLITDSPAFLGEAYARYNIDWKDKKQVYFLEEVVKILYENYHSYNYLFYFPPQKDHKSIHDGKRVHTEVKEILEIDNFIRSLMKLHKIDFTKLEGTLKDRVNKSLQIVLSSE